jgi:predicted regulator of Ras-like GTPase activity (Roadblock/LC7/MglB family)
MDTKEMSGILDRLAYHLPEMPEWIALISVDGLRIGGINFSPQSQGKVDKEDRVSILTNALNSLSSRLTNELKLGSYNLIVSSGSSGLLLMHSVYDYFLLAIKFGKEIDYATLAKIADSLPLALEELSARLRKYSP